MKKLFLTMLGVSAMLCSTSCSDEEIVASVEGEAMAQFTVELTDGSDASRAISDGLSVTELYYEVYSQVEGKEPKLMENLDAKVELKESVVDGKKVMTANVSLALVKGQAYDVVFWAQKEGAYDASNLTAITVADDNSKANDESKDAFTAVYRTSKVTGPIKETIVLKRPFAQVNFGTTFEDFANAQLAGIDFTGKRSRIEVKNAASTYNALTETAGEGVVRNFAFALLPTYSGENAEVLKVSGKDYKYLATAYVLVPEGATLADLTMVIETGLNETIVLSVPTAPIQRNYRTNVLGNLLTNTAEFNIVVDPIYNTPDNNIPVWDGISVEEPKTVVDENGETVYEVGNGAELAWIAELVNGGGQARAAQEFNIKLTSNVNLGNQPWTAIGTEENPFIGTFDGNGYEIHNLNIVEAEAKEGKAYLGLLGYAKNATIKDLTLENVYVNVACLDIDHSQGHIGAVAGSLEGTSTIENVTVKGDVKVEATTTANGASRVAVVAGGNVGGNVTMKNVHVIANEGSYLKANNNVGALAGQLQVKNVFENCSSNIDVTGTKFFAGGLIGLAAGDSQFTNCHTTGDVTITAGRAGRANDHYRVGGIAGGWADGKTKVCTLNGCSYTGKVSGTNADGSVAETLDYAGYVGRGYTLTNCAGSKVVIDGTEYVQAFDDVFGIYIVNEVYEIGTSTALKAFAKKVNAGETFAGKTVKLSADIDLKNDEWTPIGTEDKNFEGNFDGNNKVVKNLTITNHSNTSDGYAYAGLFGVTAGSEANHNYIKDLVIENVNISTTGNIVAAAVAYPYYTDIENITVKGNINIKGGAYTSGVLAYTRRCVDVKNITINGNEGSVIEGRDAVGGVISDIQMNGGLTANYSNFTATGLTLKANKNVGGISGIISKQALDGATVKNVTIVCDDERKGIVSGATGGNATITNVSYENVTGATRIIGATYETANYVGQIVEVAGAKAVVYSIEEGVKAVSVAELNLNGKKWQDAMDWAAGLGEGWALASIDELDAIHAVRVALNDALEADNANNALFEESDETEDRYLSSTKAEGVDPLGDEYFANRVHMKLFNLRGYWDVPLSSVTTINIYAPLKDFHKARGVIELAK